MIVIDGPRAMSFHVDSNIQQICGIAPTTKQLKQRTVGQEKKMRKPLAFRKCDVWTNGRTDGLTDRPTDGPTRRSD